MYKAFIEIPKGDTRRRHKKYESEELIDLGPIKDVIPVNDGVMPVHYGYILNTLNTDEEPPEELDVLFLSKKETLVSEVVEVKPIGLLVREDNDHKIIAVEKDSGDLWEDFSEEEKGLILDYFGYKSKIIKILNQEEAIKMIEKYQK